MNCRSRSYRLLVDHWLYDIPLRVISTLTQVKQKDHHKGRGRAERLPADVAEHGDLPRPQRLQDGDQARRVSHTPEYECRFGFADGKRTRPLTEARPAILMPASPALTNLLRAPELALLG